MYRKPIFSGLATNYFSYVPYRLKIRVYHLCSNFISIDHEFQFLIVFSNNSYPEILIYLHIFTNSQFLIYTYVRYIILLSLGYNSLKINKEISTLTSKNLPLPH